MTIAGPVGVSPAGSRAESGGTVTIIIPDEAEVDGDRILLGAVADIAGEDSDLVRRVKETMIARSPAPGGFRVIGKKQIEMRLKQNKAAADFHVKGPDRLKISRRSIRIPRTRIEALVREFLHQQMADGGNMEIREVEVREDALLPVGTVTHRVAAPRRLAVGGAIPLTVLFKTDGGYEKRVRASVRIAAFKEVVVAVKSLERDHHIGREDIELRRMDLSAAPPAALTDLAEATDKQVRRAIPADAPLTRGVLTSPMLVRRGDRVRIIAESGHVRLTSTGEVRRDGRKGDRIPVINLDTRKEVRAQVLDSHTVGVKF